MAYVSVPKDLTKVKNKLAFNLTKRQLICFGIGAAMGIPVFFLLRNVIGMSNAATIMVLVMLPAFMFACPFGDCRESQMPRHLREYLACRLQNNEM